VIPLKRFSVSLLNTFGTPSAPGCKRKMAFNYLVEGMKQPPSPAQQRGIELHDTLEKIAKVTIGERASFEVPEQHQIYVREVQAQGYLPEPGEHALPEHWMEMPTQFGISFVGKIDLIRYQTEPARLIDYKTMGDARYMLTPAEVHEDVQTNVYGHYLFREGMDEPLEGGLVYIEMPKTPPKKKAKVIPRLIQITKRQTGVIWESIQPVLEDILEVSQLDHPNDIEPNTAICPKYGGCPFRGECGIPMFASLGQPRHTPEKKKDTDMSFSDRLKAKVNGQTAAPVAAAPATVTPKATAKPAAAKPAPAAAKPTPAAPAAPVAAAPTFTEKMRAKKAAAVDAFGQPVGIVPPDAPPRDAGGADPLPVEAEAAVEAIEEADTAAVIVSAVEQASKTRGRPKGSTNAKIKGLTIYLDCMVTKGRGDVEATTLEDFWGPIEMELDEAAREAGKASWWDFAFAEQKAAISIKIQERIQKGLPNEIVVRQSSRFLMSDVLPLLIPHATQIVTRI
jgi:hypothetical protein